MTEATKRRVLSDYGVAWADMKRAPPKSNAQARRAAALLAEGLSVTAIAERFGVATNTVRNWVTIVRREQRA